MNIASFLTSMAQENPYQRAIVVTQGEDHRQQMRHSHINYKDLEDESLALAKGFLAQGLTPQRRAAVMIPPSFELFITTFALFKAGIVPVFIDPGIGIRNLKSCLANANPDYFIGIRKAQIARKILGWQRGQWQKILTVGSQEWQDILTTGRQTSTSLQPTKAGEQAAILFTSGSTGLPKGAVYTHENFCAQIEALRKAFAIQPGEIDLCTFPLFGLFAPALGMTAVIPEMNFTKPAEVDPDKINKAVATFGVTNIFGSPALLKRVSDYGNKQQIRYPSVKRVISAGAPVPASTLAAMKQMLPESSQVFTPYGATEALPVAITGSDEILGETQVQTKLGKGVCVGKPVPGLTLKIIKVTEEPLHGIEDHMVLGPGEIGEIIVSGDQVTRSYFSNMEANSLGKIPAKEGFYHRMGDMGYLDSQGRLWFCGRKSHRVILENQQVVFTVPGENIINQHAKVARSAIVGVGRKTNRRPILCVEPRQRLTRKERDSIKQELLTLSRKHPETNRITDVLFHPSFPVDIRHNSKIFREKLAVWAERKIQ